MIVINGTQYYTIVDAGKKLGGVSAKTVRDWIQKGVIRPPQKKRYGLREVQVFTSEYFKVAKRGITEWKKRKTVKNKRIPLGSRS